MTIALSSGCFAGYESELARARLAAVELASHPAERLPEVLQALRHNGARVVSLHAPCPNRGAGVDLAASGARWMYSAERIRESMQLAASVQAHYVIVHAFYCFAEDLPADDVQRAHALRRAANGTASISDYLKSERYEQAKRRALRNLKELLPDLKRSFPGQRLVLENLNPRLGYGGIRLCDVTDLATELGGDVGICLDVGHLTLSAAALGQEPDEEEVRRARDLIWTTHIHQNFGGRHCIDRHWDEKHARAGLQEIDPHLPFLARYRRLSADGNVSTASENSAFDGILEDAVQYAGDGEDGTVRGAVPAKRLLAAVPGAALRVLELDSRYAPLAEVVREYQLAIRGSHPFL